MGEGQGRFGNSIGVNIMTTKATPSRGTRPFPRGSDHFAHHCPFIFAFLGPHCVWGMSFIFVTLSEIPEITDHAKKNPAVYNQMFD